MIGGGLATQSGKTVERSLKGISSERKMVVDKVSETKFDEMIGNAKMEMIMTEKMIGRNGSGKLGARVK